MENVINEFTGESLEILQRIASAFSDIEKGADVSNHIDSIYRDFHTLKGTSQLFGFSKIGIVAHIVESSLGPIRSFSLPLDSSFIDIIYKATDLIERMINSICKGDRTLETFEDEINLILPKFIERACLQFKINSIIPEKNLNLSYEAEKLFVQNLSEKSPETSSVDQENLTDTSIEKNIPSPEGKGLDSLASEEKLTIEFSESDNIVSVDRQSVAPVISENKIETNKIIEKLPRVQMQEESEKISSKVNSEKKENISVADSTVRVPVEVLDRLMNLTGELVLVRNQVIQFRNRNEDAELVSLSKSLDLVTSDLQNEVMKTRMQPIGNIFTKFQRVVRDLSKDLNKQIDLTIQGAETELDKTLIESVKDPLTHIIRNSCDHGIETVEDRKNAGKPINGHVLLRAFYEGGQVIIEISDDGKGLDKNKLINKALEKGLITSDRAEKISEREAYSLIFLPGFSTAQQVTSVSGRGVGMDVVKTNIEKIGGSVELSSRLGKGTTIQLKIPLTLAIVPALIVKSEGDRYAIPQVKLVELVRVAEEDGKKIEYIQEKPMFRLRGDLLPLVALSSVLSENINNEKINREVVNIVVLDAEGEKFGIIVDDILDTTDIVVKPLSNFLRRAGTFSGATIMGDGAIALILDVVGIAERASISVQANKKQGSFDEMKTDNSTSNSEELQDFLLVKTLGKETHSIPLCLVHRLEEFQQSEVKISGQQKMTHYRNSILPLVDLNEFLKYKVPSTEKESEAQTLAVVVIQKSGRSYGIIVNEILDVISIEGQIDDGIQDRKGILGNILFEKNILVVVDVLGVIDSTFGETKVNNKLNERGMVSESSANEKISELKKISSNIIPQKKKILFAEDVVFFRKQVIKVLEKHGYESVVAENGELAFKILESRPEDFSLILSDIEMPKMNGLEFAKAVRGNEKYSQIPMIALTTRFRDSDIKTGMQAGFNLYLEKLNEDKLIEGIQRFVKENI